MPENSKPKITRPCSICYSPYRKEIEDLTASGVPIIELARKYSPILNKKLNQVRLAISNHKRKEHARLIPKQTVGIGALYNRNAPSLESDSKKAVTFNLAAEQLLKLGMDKMTELTGKDALLMAATLQKVHLEEKKVKVQEDALQLAAAKYFGGFLPDTTPVEGETIDVGQSEPGLPEEIE